MSKTRKEPASIPLFTREARIKRQLREHMRKLGVPVHLRALCRPGTKWETSAWQPRTRQLEK